MALAAAAVVVFGAQPAGACSCDGVAPDAVAQSDGAFVGVFIGRDEPEAQPVDSNDPGAAGFSGSTVIAEFESLEAAQAWADADPYVAAGVYAKVTVRPYKKVF